MQSHRLSWSCFLLAFCSLNYEFMLAQMMSILGGHTALFYCMTTGVYIFALGIGAIVPVVDLDRTGLLRRLFRLEILLCLLGGGVPFWLTLLSRCAVAINDGVPPPTLIAMVPHLMLVLVIGLMSGMELPLLMRLAESKLGQSAGVRMLVIDYLASFVGALTFPLILFPQLGMVRAAALLSALNLLAIALSVPLPIFRLRFATALMCALAVTAVYWQGDVIAQWLSHSL